MIAPRRLTLTAWSGVVAALFTACTLHPGAATTTPADPGVVVWVDPAQQPALQTAADQFTRATGTKVTIEPHAVAGIEAEFLAVAKGAKSPDLVVGSSDWTGSLVAADAVAPVELGVKASSFADVAVKAVTVNSKIYGVPYDLDTLALVRNTDLAPNAPASFDELVSTGQQLVTQNKADGVFGGGEPTQTKADPYYLYPVQASFGAPVFATTADGSYDGTKLGMNNDGGGAFATYLSGLGGKGAYDPGLTNETALAKFTAGRLPYLITDADALASIKKAGVPYAIDPIPPAGNRPATTLVTAGTYFVAAKAKHPIEAQKFALDQLGAKAAQSDAARLAARPPANKDALTAVTDHDVASYGQVALAGAPMPNVRQLPLVWSDWAATEAAILNGKSTNPTGDWKAMCDKIGPTLK